MDENRITYFGISDARNRRAPFGIKAKDRTKHVYVIGKTGMGKSTLLENMAVQDIQNGEGIAFIDPHGKTADLLLDYIPEERIKDVLYFAPFDLDNPIAFNVMEDVDPDKRFLVVAGLMSAFKKIWLDAWSARMEYILQNTLFALLEYPNSTLLDVNRMLVDKDFRKKVVAHTSDPTVKSFWVDEFAKYTDRYTAEATPAIQNKVGQFTSNALIRNIVGQAKSSFDIRKMMDEKKILIINLSKGLVGEGNANLLGSMLITKLYLSAMSRADVAESTLRNLPNFYLYVDEFQSFANESFADILSEARKYKLNLTIAHQYIEQMEEEVRDAVFGNVGTMISFRVGAFDAEVLEKEFAPQFTAEDMVNLGFTQVYLKLMIDGVSSHPFSAITMPPIAPPKESFRDSVIASSRMQFARPRSQVEKDIMEHTFANADNIPLKEKEKELTLDRKGEIKKNFQTAYIDKVLEKSKSALKPKLGGLRATLAGVLTDEEIPSSSAGISPHTPQPSRELPKERIIQPKVEPKKEERRDNHPRREDRREERGERRDNRPPRVTVEERGNFKPKPPSLSKEEVEQGKAGLKDALAKLIQKEEAEKKNTKTEEVPRNSPPPLEKNKPEPERPKSNSEPPGIPDDELRKMLDIE